MRLGALLAGLGLFAAAAEPKRFVLMPGTDHNSPQPDSYNQILRDFLDSLPRAHSRE